MEPIGDIEGSLCLCIEIRSGLGRREDWEKEVENKMAVLAGGRIWIKRR